MISKISTQRSGHPGRLINYLFGPGKANEHTHPHTVAGSVHYPGAGQEIRPQVIADLHLPKVLWPQVEFNGGHIYHFSLAVGADEGRLPDEKWERIAHDYMQGMKLEDPAKAPVRWTAVHHGLSAEGNDHIHVVVNLIREDGTKASIWQDQVRAQKVVAEVEQRHGLKVLASRLAPHGAGAVPYTQGEVITARAGNRPVDRVELERHVRAAATAAQTEAEFVSLLRQADVQVRPYPPKSGPVTGYSVALTGPDGKPLGRFYAGGDLGRDLTLPRLRGLWPDAGGSAGAALDQWRPKGSPVPSPAAKVVVGGAELEAAERVLQGLDMDLALASPAEFVELSQDLAGAAAAAAQVAPPEQRAQLAQGAREVGGWAGSTRPVKRLGPSRTQFVAMALLHSAQPGSNVVRAFVQRQLIELILGLLHSHRAARPVSITPGRGSGMSQATDDLDDVARTAINLGGSTLSMVAQRRQAAARVAATRAASGRRFHRWDGVVDNPLAPRDPVPVGFRDVLAPADWAALHADKRMALDPDGIGRWVTDIDPARPETGAALPSTRTQVILGGRLGDAVGETGKGAEIAALDRGTAAQMIRRMEARLTPDQVRGLYHDAGLAYRTVGKAGVSYELPDGTVFPIPETPASAAPKATQTVGARTAGQAPGGARRPDDWRDQPLQWASAGDPVQPAQAYTLHMWGVPTNNIEQLNKGWASAVIGAFEKGGEAAGDEMLERALEAARQQPAAPQASNAPKYQHPRHKGPSGP